LGTQKPPILSIFARKIGFFATPKKAQKRPKMTVFGGFGPNPQNLQK
jgi:hypothetical protein